MIEPEQTLRELTELMAAYERLANQRDFDALAGLLAVDASYWFTDGRHRGHEEIRAAFERTWLTIRDERYAIHDLDWVAVGGDVAACTYRFSWTGHVRGREARGQGVGTNVIARRGGAWRIVHEHLSPID